MIDGHILTEVLIALGSGFLIVIIANWREHKEIHNKIDKVHHSMRDRLDMILLYINKKPGD